MNGGLGPYARDLMRRGGGGMEETFLGEKPSRSKNPFSEEKRSTPLKEGRNIERSYCLSSELNGPYNVRTNGA